LGLGELTATSMSEANSSGVKSLGVRPNFERGQGADDGNAAQEEEFMKTMSEAAKWKLFFTSFGCIRCGQQSAAHSGNGFCTPCRSLISERLKSIPSR